LVQAQQQTQDYRCEFSDPIVLDTNNNGQIVSLEYYTNIMEGTFTMRITKYGAYSWIGMGMNLNANGNNDLMTPSYAVIGRWEEELAEEQNTNDGSFVSSASRYFLGTSAEDASGVLRLEDVHGHLKSSSFVQRQSFSDAEDEISVLEFTHDLVIRNENDYNQIDFEIVVTENNGWNPPTNPDNVDDSDPEDENDRLQAPGDRRLQQQQDGIVDFIWAVGLPENQWEGRHQLHGSIRLNMKQNVCRRLHSSAPSEAPTTIAQAVYDNVFPLTWDDGEAGGDFVEFGQEEDDDEYAAALEDQESLLQDPVKHLWLYHGVIMGVAWGIFAPVAVFTPLLRKLEFLQVDDRWRGIHFVCSITTFILTVVGFALAIMAASPVYSIDGNEENEYFTGNMHAAMGIMIVVIVVMQGAMGCCIPSDRSHHHDDFDPSSSESESTSEDGDHHEDSKSKKSGPLHTMIVENKVINEQGKLVPNRTAYKQYMPKRYSPAALERARRRAEATTVLGATAVGDETESEVKVANLSPQRTGAYSNNLEAIEVVEIVDKDFLSHITQKTDKSDDMVPTKVTVDSDDVSELEEPDPSQEEDEEDLVEKSDFLICWIFTHRLLGFALFAMAMYACHTGIILQSEIIANEGEDAPTYWSKNRTLAIFWGVSVGIIVAMLLLRIIYPRFQSSRKKVEQETKTKSSTKETSSNPSSSSTKGSREGTKMNGEYTC